MHHSKFAAYSITSSALTYNVRAQRNRAVAERGVELVG
jgi:hypothetical protein